MNERDLWWKIVIIGGLMALAFASVWPPNEKLKYGIDLYGGYSLTYEIDDTGLEGPEKENLSADVIRVLKNRVDPKGVFNLVWRPIGHNRLEIQMPRPSEDVREARTEYEKFQERIQNSHVRRSEVLRALARTGADRQAAIETLVRNVENRRPLLEKAAQSFDSLASAQKSLEEREAQVKADNLAESDVKSAIERPAAERQAALAGLVRGIPERQALLDEAAKLWDELEALRPTTQPAPPPASQPSQEVVKQFQMKENAYGAAVRAVLAKNVDVNNLKDGVTINTVVAEEEKLDEAVNNVLATNIDTGRLQSIIDSKPGQGRDDQIKAMTGAFPGLMDDIQGMVRTSDSLRENRRGEGRLEDPADLQRLLRGAGVLEFRILAERGANPTQFDSYTESLKNRGPRARPGEESYQWFEIEDPKDFLKLDDPHRDFESRKAMLGGQIVVERYGDKFYVLAHIGDSYTLTHKPGAQEWQLTGAQSGSDDYGRPSIDFQLDERGGSKFDSITRNNLQRQLAIFLDDQSISHATIQSAIRTRGQITGQFTRQEVNDMVRKLQAGSLPKKLKEPPISVRSIGPSLGEANREAGLKAAKWGCVLVVAFMLVFYRYAGLVAIFAVAMNTLIILAVTAAMGATWTLPGIAGLVLSIGMAVDANVLINERIREELARGAVVRMAVKIGYERAFSAILDSNLTTILTCIILYFLGSEEIKGFGLTLGIGTLANLFTAYFVTRIYFEIMTMSRVPTEVARYPLFTAIGVSAFGALVYGLGHLVNEPAALAQSVLVHFGKALILSGPIIVLIIGTIWLCRAIHAWYQKDGRQGIPMMKLFATPAIDWCGKRYLFLGISGVAVFLGALLFFGMPNDKLYDIEFLGGTAAQVDLKEPGSMTNQEVKARLAESGENLKNLGDAIASATVSGSGDTWVIQVPNVRAVKLVPVIRDVMDRPDNKRLSELSPIQPLESQVTVRTKPEAKIDQAAMTAFVKEFGERLRKAGESMQGAQVQSVGETPNASFEIVTRETSKDIVVSAIMDTLQDRINVQPALSFKLARSQTGSSYFPITSERAEDLSLPVNAAELAGVDFQGWRGGVAIVLDEIAPPQTAEAIRDRLRAMRFQPGFEDTGWRETDVIGITHAGGAGDAYSRVLIRVIDENYPIEQGSEPSALWASNFAEKEVRLVQEGLERQTSLSQITQFDKQVSGEAQTDAYLALALSWLGIIIYLWFRFGDARWGLAAVVALVHDILIVCLFIAISHFIAETAFGKNVLLLDKFRIDLTMVAALLTIVGYSVNDTIVVYDRIRENRGRMSEVTRPIVNSAISQTLSRTMLTGVTTIGVILVMYIIGGEGIHGFTFAMLIGILAGTYSSFGIAGQLLLSRRARATA